MGKKNHKYYRHLEKSHMKTELIENELQKGHNSSTYLPATSKPLVMHSSPIPPLFP